MSDKLYIYGASGHAKVIAATARLCGYEIAGFWEDSEERIGQDFFESKIIPFEHVPIHANVFIAFGNNEIRLKRGNELKDKYNIPSIIHPSAQIATNVKIGIGTYIGAMANIDPDCLIGDFCIVNNCANISHEAIIKDGCHICGGVQIAGCCKVGNCSMIGIGACVIDHVCIGDYSIIGAGSTVISNFPSNVIAVGCPAKIIKQNNHNNEEHLKR